MERQKRLDGKLNEAKIIDEPVSRSIEQEGRDMEMREGRVHDSPAQPLSAHAHIHTYTYIVAYASTACCGLCRLSLQHVFVISLRRSYQLLTKASLVSTPARMTQRVYVHA